MMREIRCAIDPNLIVKGFKHKFEDAVCPWCETSFHYCLPGSFISKINLMDLTSDEAETYDGTGL